jgi:glycosyltransferase involved in cell wall biosynthesis
LQPYRAYDGIDGPRVAIAHDYLTQRGGAEKVVLSMSRIFPEAPIYAMLYDPENTYSEFADRDVRVSKYDKIGVLRRNHRPALPVLPLVANSMFIDADVVLTSSSGWAHGFHTNGRKLVHCHSPARWLYLGDMYLGEHSGLIKRAGLAASAPYLRRWDRRAAHSVDRYLAVSTVIQQRIRDVYGIESGLVPSPVALSRGDSVEPVAEVQTWIGADEVEDEFYLCVSRLLPYKNVEAVARSFAGTQRRLVIVGRGPEAERIRSILTPNVLMVSDLTDAQMSWLYRNCRAVIAASYEDFGLTPIEAGVWGRPSVVLRWGGFLDTVDEGVTGVYFDEPEPHSIAGALDRFEASVFDPAKVQEHVRQFSEERFAERIRTEVDALAKVRGR